MSAAAEQSAVQRSGAVTMGSNRLIQIEIRLIDAIRGVLKPHERSFLVAYQIW